MLCEPVAVRDEMTRQRRRLVGSQKPNRTRGLRGCSDAPSHCTTSAHQCVPFFFFLPFLVVSFSSVFFVFFFFASVFVVVHNDFENHIHENSLAS